jgi:hypothetical protein
MHPITLTIPGPAGYLEPSVEPKKCTCIPWLARFFMYGFIAALVYGNIQFDGSYTLAPSVNYHSLGMALSTVCCGEIILVSLSPSSCSKSITTYMTFGSHIMGIILGAGGMVAIVYSTSSHLFSVHSWTGIVFCGSLLLQGVTRLTSYTRLNSFFSKVTYISGVAACMLGLQEQQSQSMILPFNQTETTIGISASTFSCITSVLLVVSSLATLAAFIF